MPRPVLEPPSGAQRTSMSAWQSCGDVSSRWNHITCSDCKHPLGPDWRVCPPSVHRSAGGMGRIGKGKIGMPKAKKARPKEGLRTPTVTTTAEEAGPSSPSSQRTAGQPAAPPSPGKQLRLEAGRSVRKLKGAYFRAARRFFNAWHYSLFHLKI